MKQALLTQCQNSVMDRAYSTKWDDYSIITTIVVMVIVAVAGDVGKEGGRLVGYLCRNLIVSFCIDFIIYSYSQNHL